MLNFNFAIECLANVCYKKFFKIFQEYRPEKDVNSKPK